MDHLNNLKLAEKGAWISIIAYLVLSIIKLYIAYVGNSNALRADGLNNVTDIIASLAVLIGLKIARKPPDSNHLYGHSRAETIASLFAAFIMIAVGFQVVMDTFSKMIAQEAARPDMLTAWTALFAACIMFFVYFFNVRLAKKTNSSGLYAAAQDNRSDALVSIGAFIGIMGAQFGIYWLDPLAGFIVGIIICWTAWSIFKDATHTLTDGIDEEQIEEIIDIISKNQDVKEIADVKGRIHGNRLLIDITILVDPNLNVEESHQITERIEKQLMQHIDIWHAHIHIEPYYDKK